MTTTYDPAESERLIAEAREDDARLPVGPWIAGRHGYVSAPNPAGGPGSTRCPLRDNTGDPRATDAISRTRNNLRAMADQLEAARAEMSRRTEAWSDAEHRVDALTTELEAARARIAELEAVARAYVDQRRQLDAARAEVERMAPVVAAALAAETARANLHEDKSTLNWTAKCEADAALAAALAKVKP